MDKVLQNLSDTVLLVLGLG